MLQRKHYNDLAKQIASFDWPTIRERNEFLDNLCIMLIKDNPSFNRTRFINAATCMPGVPAQ